MLYEYYLLKIESKTEKVLENVYTTRLHKVKKTLILVVFSLNYRNTWLLYVCNRYN